jgi:predicted AAA+ superfamily ATPase
LIAGPRGIGKTTFLLSQARKHGRAVYLSGDNPKVNIFGLYDLASGIFARGYQTLIVDEVHFARDWSQHLKSLYDDHPHNRLWVSDSSSIILRKGSHDLSRRMPRLCMLLLSFREFLTIKLGIPDLEAFNPLRGERPSGPWTDVDDIDLKREFYTYLQSGTRPFFLEGRYAEKTLGIIEKTTFSDVPYFTENLQGSYLSLMQAVLTYLAISPVPTLNIDSLSRQWGLGRPKIYELLAVMNHLELIKIVRKKSDHSQGKGAKILLVDPTWYPILGGNKGSSREAFVAAMLAVAGVKFFAMNNDNEADHVTPFGTLEIGGATKRRKAADFAVRDDALRLSAGGGVPLWMLGCLY